MNSSEKFSSPLISFFIGIGLIFIIFLLYLIGTELYKVHSLEKIFQEEEEELSRQKSKNVILEEEGMIRSTAEYLDRFAKENNDKIKPGEVVIIVPPEASPTPDIFPKNSTVSFSKYQSVREQWKNVFFGKK